MEDVHISFTVYWSTSAHMLIPSSEERSGHPAHGSLMLYLVREALCSLCSGHYVQIFLCIKQLWEMKRLSLSKSKVRHSEFLKLRVTLL